MRLPSFEGSPFIILKVEILVEKHKHEIAIKEKYRIFWKCILGLLLIKFIGSLIVTTALFCHFNALSTLLKAELRLTDTLPLDISMLLIAVILPAVEEIAFRGWLADSAITTIVSLTFLSYYLSYVVIALVSLFCKMNWAFKLWLMAFLLIFAFLILLKQKTKVTALIEKNKTLLILSSIFSFTLMHAFNYQIKDFKFETIVSLFLILLPIPFFAYVLTYIRIKNGLLWSFALHALNNSLALVPIFISGAKI